MKNKVSLPFQNLSPEAWQNLALAAIIAFYIAFLGYFMINTKICESYRVDYCAFWTSGRIINEREIADIYNLEILSQYQKEIYLPESSTLLEFKPVEIPYLPIFVMPFSVLSLIKLTPSYLIWLLINCIGFILYLRFFIKKLEGVTPPFRISLMIMLSLPVFINLYEGQVNFWLGICAGEFMRAFISENDYKAGIWLGGWLLKPQVLLLIIPFLLIKRSIKTLSGFALSTIIALAISFGLIGKDGVLNLIMIIADSAGGGATSNTFAMMNWRMLGWHISSLTSENIGSAIMIIGSLLTAGITIIVFTKSEKSSSISAGIKLLGIFAATNVIAWHAHLHMAVILLPPMIFLLVKDYFNKKLFMAWLFVPVLIEFFAYVYLAFINLGIIPDNIYPIEKLVRGLTVFILNLLILGWTIVEFNRMNKKTIIDKTTIDENEHI